MADAIFSPGRHIPNIFSYNTKITVHGKDGAEKFSFFLSNKRIGLSRTFSIVPQFLFKHGEREKKVKHIVQQWNSNEGIISPRRFRLRRLSTKYDTSQKNPEKTKREVSFLLNRARAKKKKWKKKWKHMGNMFPYKKRK